MCEMSWPKPKASGTQFNPKRLRIFPASNPDSPASHATHLIRSDSAGGPECALWRVFPGTWRSALDDSYSSFRSFFDITSSRRPSLLSKAGVLRASRSHRTYHPASRSPISTPVSLEHLRGKEPDLVLLESSAPKIMPGLTWHSQCGG